MKIRQRTARRERKKSRRVEREAEDQRLPHKVAEAVGTAVVEKRIEDIAALRGEPGRDVVRRRRDEGKARRERNHRAGAITGGFWWRRSGGEGEHGGEEESDDDSRKMVDRIVAVHDGEREREREVLLLREVLTGKTVRRLYLLLRLFL
ncbi:unnamed protein product [Camellia sinensis]